MEEIIDYLNEYTIRKNNNIEELKTAFLDLFDDRYDAFTFLVKNMDNSFSYRNDVLKELDCKRAADRNWYNQHNSYGMTLYADNNENKFKNLIDNIEYLSDFDISFINIAPVLRPDLVYPKPGGVPEFVSVSLEYGTVAELHKFCMVCHEHGISVCFDNVGDYCSIDNITKILDNPLVFNKMIYDLLMFANLGVDIFKINTRPYSWNDLGLEYPYGNQNHSIVRMIRVILDIVCPGCILMCDGEYNEGNSFSYFGSLYKQECQLINNISNRAFLLEAIETKNVLKLRNMIDSLLMISRNNVFINYIQEPWHDKNEWMTTAALCGLDKAKDMIEVEYAVDFDMMLHGCLMVMPGVPFMYLGDELGQIKGKSMDWSKTKLRFNTDTYQYKLYNNLTLLKRIRAVYDVFSRDAKCFTYDTFDPAVLGVVRSIGDKKIIALFNFSANQRTAWIIDPGPYTDILSNAYIRDQSISIKPYGMMWLYNQRPETLEDF